jgi:uncharacterized protein
VYTEESSQQATPLNEERAAPPAIVLGEEVQPLSTPETGSSWLEVIKSLVLWGSSVMLLLFIPVIVALPYLVYRIAAFGPPTPQVLAEDKMLLFYSVLGILPAHLLTLAVTWMVVTEGGRRPFWKTIGFEWPERATPTTTTLLSVLTALALFGFAYLVTLIYGEKKTDLDMLIESSIYTRVATAFMASATAPLVEEVIYRGVLYRSLEKAAGLAVAIPVVSLLFAGVHVYQYRNNIAVILVITLLSIVLTVSRAVTGKLLPAFIIHLVFNGIQAIFIVLGGFIDTDPLK